MTPGPRFRQALETEAAELAQLRMRAMRPSLEALGRFDATRAQNRFLEGFVAEDTQVVEDAGLRVGVFVLRTHAQYLYLDHLYIDPAYQGRGLGQTIVTHIQDRARETRLPVRLIALEGSSSNRFYQNAGFACISQDGVDRLYEWQP